MPQTDEKEGGRARRQTRTRRVALTAALTLACSGFILLTACDSSTEGEKPPAVAVPLVDPQSSSSRPASPIQNIDFSKFSHTSSAHGRLSCLLCHRHEEDGGRPSRPGHTPCAGCHSQQFADPQSSMCAICHTRPGSAAIKPFPRLKSFGVSFDHSLHGGVGCSTCHKPAQRGVALSIPSGAAAHQTCYQCHSPRAQSEGRDISSCGTCHTAGGDRTSGQSARAFKVNFSHARHGRAQRLGCADCHSVRQGEAAVTSPQPAQHKASPLARSCMSCHNGKRAFGGENFADCKRCHTGNNFSFSK